MWDGGAQRAECNSKCSCWLSTYYVLEPGTVLVTMAPHSCTGSWENLGIPPSDDDKREPLDPRVTGQCFPASLTAEPRFQAKPCREPQYLKREPGSYLANDPGAQGEGGICQRWPGPWRPGHLLTPCTRGRGIVPGEIQNQVPASMWDARTLNAKARTLAMGSAGADCIGGL